MSQPEVQPIPFLLQQLPPLIESDNIQDIEEARMISGYLEGYDPSGIAGHNLHGSISSIEKLIIGEIPDRFISKAIYKTMGNRLVRWSRAMAFVSLVQYAGEVDVPVNSNEALDLFERGYNQADPIMRFAILHGSGRRYYQNVLGREDPNENALRASRAARLFTNKHSFVIKLIPGERKRLEKLEKQRFVELGIEN